MSSPKLVILSGGSRGLGLAMLKQLLAEGYAVASFSRSCTAEIESLLAEFPETLLWHNLDASDRAGLINLVNTSYQQFGNLYGLVNNAAIGYDGVLATMNEDKMDLLLEINLKSVIQLTQLAINKMILKQNGVILNISSIVGSTGYSGLSVYSATKAGLDGLTRSLARELGAVNIRANSIAPGYIETEMSKGLGNDNLEKIRRRTPLGRLGTTEDIANGVKFLLSDEAQFITGQTLFIDGGINC